MKQLFASPGYVDQQGVQVDRCKLKQQGFKVQVVELGKQLVKVEHFNQSTIEASGSPGRYSCPFLVPRKTHKTKAPAKDPLAPVVMTVAPLRV